MTSSTAYLSEIDAPQVAVNDIGSEEDFLAAIDATIKYFNDGDIVEGTIVKVDRDEVLLDIGYKTEGVIPSRELSIKHDVDPNEVVKVGDKVEALVLQKEDKEGRLILSKKRAQYERAWGTIEQVKEEDGVVEGTVIEVVKGGLILDIGLRGFLPASLVEMRRVRDLQPYVGQTLEAKIIELDKNRNNVVLSRRAWLEQTQSEVRHGFLTQLQKGQIRKGVVSSIVNFGAFVDLGGVDGLVHVSELSWKHIDHPSEVVAVGDEVTVEVLDVDMDRERVSLSLKATQEDPWQHFARTHQIGQIVPGKVTKLVPFGSFVRVEEGIEGLVHISELAERHVEIPEQVVQVNDDVMVKIIDIDLERRRISLSLKQANETTTATDVEEFDPTLYGMAATYDEQGNYIYPDGFDPETGEWLEGYDEQRAAWEDQYAKAHARWEAHVKQQEEAKQAEVEAGEATTYSSGTTDEVETGEETGGSLASDEALQALREKLTGGACLSRSPERPSRSTTDGNCTTGPVSRPGLRAFRAEARSVLQLARDDSVSATSRRREPVVSGRPAPPPLDRVVTRGRSPRRWPARLTRHAPVARPRLDGLRRVRTVRSYLAPGAELPSLRWAGAGCLVEPEERADDPGRHVDTAVAVADLGPGGPPLATKHHPVRGTCEGLGEEGSSAPVRAAGDGHPTGRAWSTPNGPDREARAVREVVLCRYGASVPTTASSVRSVNEHPEKAPAGQLFAKSGVWLPFDREPDEASGRRSRGRGDLVEADHGRRR